MTVSDLIGENLALIVAALTELFNRGSTDALEAMLDEKVVWRGVFPGEICHDRNEVMATMVGNRARPPRITRIEAEEKGDQVAVSVEGPDFQNEGRRAVGPPAIVFTFTNGRVVKMQSVGSPDEAFSAVGRAR